MDVFQYVLNKLAGEVEDIAELSFDDTDFIDFLPISLLDVLTLADIDPKLLGGMKEMFSVADITITSLDVITAYSLAGAPRFVLDELQDATIANTQEREDITGKGGRKLNTLKRNKAVTISGTNGLLSGGLLEAQTGSQFESKTAAPVAWSESLVINGGKATTTYKATGTAGAEIEALYIKTSDGRASTKLEQDATAAAGKFAYAPETKELSFQESAYPDGTEIAVFYTRKVAGDVLNNDSEKYSEKLRLVVDATGEDKCANVYHVQIEIPKADFSGDFDIAMGDSQSVHAFEAESLAGVGCGAAAKGYLWTYTVFGANAEDAA